MFERFTNRARHVVVLAQEEARRLQHNYIGTEHVLLGLLAETGGVAFQALERFGFTIDGARDEVQGIIGLGKTPVSGHIPFTPRAKKTLELALREALQLHHDYIGTEHILLGLIREGQGVAAQIMKQHSDGDLTPIRLAVLGLVPAMPAETGGGRRWWRRGFGGGAGEETEPANPPELRTTPAADTSLREAARLAGGQPVGSHHLLLAALSDPDTAAARVLVALGLHLDQVQEALAAVDVTGTSDEQPEEAGRRQMVIAVSDDKLTIEARDPVIVGLGRATAEALGDQANPPGTIRGDLPISTPVAAVWQALHDSLETIRRTATTPGESADVARDPNGPDQPDQPDQPGNAVA